MNRIIIYSFFKLKEIENDIKYCLNGGTCIYHNQKCLCSCQPGFTGLKCEIKDSCTADFNLNPCKNGALCFSRDEGPVCSCRLGWAGDFCDQPTAGSNTSNAVVSPSNSFILSSNEFNINFNNNLIQTTFNSFSTTIKRETDHSSSTTPNYDTFILNSTLSYFNECRDFSASFCVEFATKRNLCKKNFLVDGRPLHLMCPKSCKLCHVNNEKNAQSMKTYENTNCFDQNEPFCEFYAIKMNSCTKFLSINGILIKDYCAKSCNSC